jgi:hypothetical protein
MEKVNKREDMGRFNRTIKILRKNPKGNARYKKHCNRNEECLW